MNIDSNISILIQKCIIYYRDYITILVYDEIKIVRYHSNQSAYRGRIFYGDLLFIENKFYYIEMKITLYKLYTRICILLLCSD